MLFLDGSSLMAAFWLITFLFGIAAIYWSSQRYRAARSEQAHQTNFNRSCPVCQTGINPNSLSQCRICGWGANRPLNDFRLQQTLAILSKAFDEKRISRTEYLELANRFRDFVHPKSVAPSSRQTQPVTQPGGQKADEPEIIMADLVILDSETNTAKSQFAKATANPESIPVTKTQLPATARTSPVSKRRPSSDAESKTTTTIATNSITNAVNVLPENQVAEPNKGLDDPSKKSFRGFLLGFMEEKNIRWGEVVGGLLIVSCSIALVISFWSAISSQPVLKFGVFTAVTASFFGLGLHANRKWKLPNTAHGILLIALLLVPLNFLAIASFSEAAELTTGMLLAELVTIGIFGYCCWLATAVLLGKQCWPTTISVIGQSAYLLIVRRILVADVNTWHIVLVLAGAISCYLPVVFLFWKQKTAMATMNDDHEFQTNRVLATIWKALGVSSFAFVVSAGFFVVRALQYELFFQASAPLWVIAAIP